MILIWNLFDFDCKSIETWFCPALTNTSSSSANRPTTTSSFRLVLLRILLVSFPSFHFSQTSLRSVATTFLWGRSCSKGTLRWVPVIVPRSNEADLTIIRRRHLRFLWCSRKIDSKSFTRGAGPPTMNRLSDGFRLSVNFFIPCFQPRWRLWFMFTDLLVIDSPTHNYTHTYTHANTQTHAHTHTNAHSILWLFAHWQWDLCTTIGVIISCKRSFIYVMNSVLRIALFIITYRLLNGSPMIANHTFMIEVKQKSYLYMLELE